MIHKMPSPQPGNVRIIFELPACIWADRIYLVGDFNEWNVESTPFMQGRDGVWRAVVDLAAGRNYQFRYLVDGSWQTDYHADSWIDNEFGSQNSIVQATLGEQEPVQASETAHLPEELHRNGRYSRGTTISPIVQPQRPGRFLKPSLAKVAG